MIEITENAAAQIHKMLAKRGSAETGLRVGVKAGGCSGFEYVFGWETRAERGRLGVRGRRTARRSSSIRGASGCSTAPVLDYDTSLLSKGFVFNNPHAKSTCGCGVSFSVS